MTLTFDVTEPPTADSMASKDCIMLPAEIGLAFSYSLNLCVACTVLMRAAQLRERKPEVTGEYCSSTCAVCVQAQALLTKPSPETGDSPLSARPQHCSYYTRWRMKESVEGRRDGSGSQ